MERIIEEIDVSVVKDDGGFITHIVSPIEVFDLEKKDRMRIFEAVRTYVIEHNRKSTH